MRTTEAAMSPSATRARRTRSHGRARRLGRAGSSGSSGPSLRSSTGCPGCHGREPDPLTGATRHTRVVPSPAERRRTAALAGHGGDEAGARRALADPDPATRAVALGALARLGVLTEDEIRAALADDAPAVRVRAVELAVPVTAVDLVPLLTDPDPFV